MRLMNRLVMAFLLALCWLLATPARLMAQSAASTWPPTANGEELIFHLLWPSGLTLGEGTLTAVRAGAEVHLEATVIADLPQHPVSYTFGSVTDERLCSVQFRQHLREGPRTTDETFTFNQEQHTVQGPRGQDTIPASHADCARDPLALLYYFRWQLATSRLPIGTPEAVGSFYLGEGFTVRYEAIAPETVKLGTRQWEGDRFLITAQGTHGREQIVEVWIRLDEARTPVAVRVPFSLATFAAELQ
jgi:hypothetical protein